MEIESAPATSEIESAPATSDVKGKKPLAMDLRLPWQDLPDLAKNEDSHVLDIVGEDARLIDNGNSLRKHSRSATNGYLDPWDAFFSASTMVLLIGQLWALGNPFVFVDVLYRMTNTATAPQLVTWRQSFPMFLPAITWTALFLLNLCLAVKHAWSRPRRVLGVIMLFLLVASAYFFSALAVSVSGMRIVCGSVKMPGVLFVTVGALAFVLLVGLIIMGARFTIPCFCYFIICCSLGVPPWHAFHWYFFRQDRVLWVGPSEDQAPSHGRPVDQGGVGPSGGAGPSHGRPVDQGAVGPSGGAGPSHGRPVDQDGVGPSGDAGPNHGRPVDQGGVGPSGGAGPSHGRPVDQDGVGLSGDAGPNHGRPVEPGGVGPSGDPVPKSWKA